MTTTQLKFLKHHLISVYWTTNNSTSRCPWDTHTVLLIRFIYHKGKVLQLRRESKWFCKYFPPFIFPNGISEKFPIKMAINSETMLHYKTIDLMSLSTYNYFTYLNIVKYYYTIISSTQLCYLQCFMVVGGHCWGLLISTVTMTSLIGGSLF